MTTEETTATLNAARDLFCLTNAKLEKLAADPEQLLSMTDIVEAS